MQIIMIIPHALTHRRSKEIYSLETELRLAIHADSVGMAIIADVERTIGWPKLWDLALDYGPRCVDELRNLVRILTFPPHAQSACRLCEELDTHTTAAISGSDLVTTLKTVSVSFVIVVLFV